jgi:dihydroneopterin aldolase
LATDVASGAATDQLEDTLDYAAISQRVIAEVEASSYQLIESLAEHLAGLIRTDFAVPWLRIVVTKPTAVAEADAVGVVIERGSRPQAKVK